MPEAAPRGPLPPFTEKHERLRGEIRRFVAEELRPHARQWENISITTPPIWSFGTDDQQRRFLSPAIRGEKIAALAACGRTSWWRRSRRRRRAATTDSPF